MSNSCLNEIATIMEISKATKTNDKIQILRENDSQGVRTLLYCAFNTFNVYGIKSLDFKKSEVTGYFHKKHYEFCNILKMLMVTSVNNKVREEVVSFLESCNQPQQAIYYDILRKDLRIGMQAKNINKAFEEDFIPQFAVMTCDPYETQDLDKPLLVQKKYDGYRCLIIKDGLSINCFSRNGNPIPLLNISKELSKIQSDFVLDGELISTTRTSTSGICNSLIKGNKEITDELLVFKAFDLLPLVEYKMGKFTVPCKERLLNLGAMVLSNKLKRIQVADTIETTTTDEVLKIYKAYRAQGEEGIIIKDPMSLYETKRSQNWLKLKAINSCTLKVIDKYEHKNGDSLGGLVCQSLCGELTVNVGGGFTDEDREIFWKAPMNGTCIEVLYNEVQKDKYGQDFLFLPRFKEMRIDKDKPDTLETILRECN